MDSKHQNKVFIGGTKVTISQTSVTLLWGKEIRCAQSLIHSANRKHCFVSDVSPRSRGGISQVSLMLLMR